MKSTQLSIVIKVVLSVLLLVCLFDMPYGYYQLVRFIAMLGFALLVYFSYQSKQNIAVIVYIGLIILFNPIIKIALGRIVWNVVDMIVAVGLIASFFVKRT